MHNLLSAKYSQRKSEILFHYSNPIRSEKERKRKKKDTRKH